MSSASDPTGSAHPWRDRCQIEPVLRRQNFTVLNESGQLTGIVTRRELSDGGAIERCLD
jgi:hypothetical protein